MHQAILPKFSIECGFAHITKFCNILNWNLLFLPFTHDLTEVIRKSAFLSAEFNTSKLCGGNTFACRFFIFSRWHRRCRRSPLRPKVSPSASCRRSARWQESPLLSAEIVLFSLFSLLLIDLYHPCFSGTVLPAIFPKNTEILHILYLYYRYLSISFLQIWHNRYRGGMT